jgi:hypothetical protein
MSAQPLPADALAIRCDPATLAGPAADASGVAAALHAVALHARQVTVCAPGVSAGIATR